jgi:transposase
MSTATLRDENERLKALLVETQAALSEHQAALATSEEARRRLEVILGELRREKFGAKSEKLRPDQYHLPLEDVEIAQGILDSAQEKATAIIRGRSRAGSDQDRDRNRSCLPAHLPRVERIIEPASTLCPCGCGAMTKIGEDVSKRLDVIPAQWRVLVTRRPKYVCRRCSGAVVQAHAPEHVVPGGLPTEAAIAHVIVSKFGDHTPFYRQAGIYARQGIRLDRATLGNWSGRACFHLQPVGDHMRRHLATADRLFMDETTAPVLDPGRGETKKGYFWAIASDDRGHSGPSPPIVLFRYASGRSGAFAEQFLAGLTGASCNVTDTTVMTGSRSWFDHKGHGRSCIAGAICAGASSNWRATASRRSPRLQSGRSHSFTPSKPRSAAYRRTSGWPRARSIRCLSSPR